MAGLAARLRFAVVEFADGHELAARTVTFEEGGLRLDRPIEPTFVPDGRSSHAPGAGAVRQQRFLLGSDRFGRDVAARLLAGGRVSLAVAALVVACILALGVPLGALAAIAPARVDGSC
ncbi:MAG: hypothetical protein R2862_10965 [Thermoanaerobaculia bacterium]